MIKHDGAKLRYHLVPKLAEEVMVGGLTFGAMKYGEHKWRAVPNGEDRYYSALRRHVEAMRRGEYLDPDSGLPHASGALCSLMFLAELAVEQGGRPDYGSLVSDWSKRFEAGP